ncbi:Lariat debranching enzyme [Psilocybe cubensis]|uniref:Lariat debranching enzyme n=2 Tax=Psilocybe cubensis TaxID=181762 RepID=A0ACB8H5B1_PSICU|nr:Lariat debranching enzyme [Psilocybe cubensis]KAH9483024.1 Lariat debranching enzyme [Psilocybe cubensis]
MKIAVEGCCHGELDAIYSHIGQLERKNGYKVDVLLICGDFQAVRNHQDLQCMSVPAKYRQLQHFYKYYTGEKQAPVLTLVIGGNHEASNYMWELYHGGWLAPNIYFLGHAGCVRVNGVSIAGASGIFKANDFKYGHYEKVPYDQGSMRSIYHIREYCVRKLSLLSETRIFLSHDWPQSIEHHGDLAGLLHRKTFLRADIEKGALGSPPLMGLLRTLKPEWWFAAHLHTRYEAVVVHEPALASVPGTAPVANPDEIRIEDEEGVEREGEGEGGSGGGGQAAAVSRNPDEILLEDEEETVETPPLPPPRARETKFLALDKCLPRRQFLEVIDIDTPTPSPDEGPVLTFDEEWLAITRAFHPWLSTTRHQPPFPDEADARGIVARERAWVRENVRSLAVSECQSFARTAPGPGHEGGNKFKQRWLSVLDAAPWYTNPQTEAFCRMLDIPNKINPPPTNV